MAEQLRVYDVDGKDVGIWDRDEYYRVIREQNTKNEQISYLVDTVKALVFTERGRIWVQTRSLEKSDNAGLMDKSVGGHVKAHLTPDESLHTELQQELNVPGIIVQPHRFRSMLAEMDLNVQGVFTNVQYDENFISRRIYGKEEVLLQPQRVNFYVGCYAGPIKFADGEAEAIGAYSVERLESLIQKSPSLFTEDLIYMLQVFKNKIIPSVK